MSTPTRGYTATKDQLQNRLARIEGQVRGVSKMVDEDRYCIDVLTQVSAATKARESVALLLLEEHLGHCVADAIQSGGDEADHKVREASAAIARLLEPCASPTTTSTPDSFRLSAWAWPWLPKPMIATVWPARADGSASLS